jgi:hypothetical protein
MLYYEFEAGNNVYKLRLNTRNIVSLEKSLGCNPVMVFGAGDRVPTVTQMVAILNASMQTYHHGMTTDRAYDIFDAWLGDGHVMTDFIPVIIEIYRASGIMKAENSPGDTEDFDAGDSEKN